jgi:serine/threonine protein kinase
MLDGATGIDDLELKASDSEVSMQPQGLLGRTIDRRYRVESLLGEGGMGLVYRVTHTHLNKPLAIKVLRRENTRDPEVLARFRREAESASAIGNEHIVDISDFGVLDDGSTFFVMECLDGIDLIDAIDVAQRMPEERAIRIAIQVCRALGAAHNAGIVHRDLKPENVFLTRRKETEDFVKILDFGIAKVANGPKRLTRAGEVLGTPHYMSPEQCEGDNVDHRTDIYALGVLMYEMVTGHVPHDADTMMGILTKQMYEDPIPPKVRVPQLSEQLEQLIMRCLEKKPDQRYQTMHEIEEDLRRLREGQVPVGPDTVTLTPTRPPSSGRTRISPLYFGGLGLAFLALVGTLVINAANERPQVGQTVQPVPRSEPLEARVTGPTEEPTLASAIDAPEAEVQTPSPKRARRKVRQASKAPLQHDQAILDPWK